MYVFGKTIETAKGVFREGQALPMEWTGKETIRQLRETYGEDAVLIPADSRESLSAIGQRLTAIETSVDEIKAAVGVGEKKKKLNA